MGRRTLQVTFEQGVIDETLQAFPILYAPLMLVVAVAASNMEGVNGSLEDVRENALGNAPHDAPREHLDLRKESNSLGEQLAQQILLVCKVQESRLCLAMSHETLVNEGIIGGGNSE
ncbi:hypothetical protein IW261DRAFT_1566058 [Armillaria novae-zelandiae]|uniref:Uncharacterized protein n=1 Tax=Armillaria novae-zelandiae TaxID=153914 RepID=A0AA39U943_9AGAR|nr:hypothetical protein IW261DRAFT_1566058 [Armillaria novae-zelandiae]